MHGSLRDVEADDHGLRRGGGSHKKAVVYDGQQNELHRPGRDHAAGTPLAQGEALRPVGLRAVHARGSRLGGPRRGVTT